MDGVRTAPEPPQASIFALSVLLLVVLAAPWAMGGVSPLAVRLLALTSLTTSAAVLFMQAAAGASRPSVPAWPLVAIGALGVFQLVPLPESVLRVVAPGSARVWHSADPAVAAVLGPGPHPVSLSPDATAIGLGLWVGLVALAYLAAPAVSSSRGAVIAAAAVAFSGAALSVYAIVTRAAFGPLLYGQFPVPTVMPFGPFVSKNHFAGYVAMAAALTLGLTFDFIDREKSGSSSLSWIDSRRAYRILLGFGAVVVMVAAVLVSLSRGGAVSLGAGVVTLLALRSRKAASPLRLIVPLVALAMAVVAVLPADVHRRLSTLAEASRDDVVSFRVDTWRASMRLVAGSPIVGSGIGAYVDALPPYKRTGGGFRIEHAENDYLEWLGETGVVGGVLGAAALVGLWRSARRRLADGVGTHRAIAMGALGAVTALLVHSAVDFNTRLPSNAALFLLALAMACHPGGSRASRLATVATGVFLLGCGVRIWMSPSSAVATPRSDALAASAITDPSARALRVTRAESALVPALRRRPADAEAWFLLGWTRFAQGRTHEAAAFARRAVELDPARTALRERARALEQAAALRR